MTPDIASGKKLLLVSIIRLFCLTGIMLLSCTSNSTETTASADSTVQRTPSRDPIVSFEALFAPGQYGKFLDHYWTEGCNNTLYPISKALSRRLDCPCTNILPTIDKNDLTISLNNINCFPPEVEEAKFHPEHQITLPLETLRPFLHETGQRIVYESGTYLQDWLADQKRMATTVKESPYTLYISLIQAGQGFRVVLQSDPGANNQEGTITGYYEMEDGRIIDVTGYRTWGGFVVYDRTKDSGTGLEFFWDDQAQGDMSHAVRNRFLSASSQAGAVYIEYVKLIGEFSLYEGPEDPTREPENGVPDTGN
jgi:hypothetical protein